MPNPPATLTPFTPGGGNPTAPAGGGDTIHTRAEVTRPHPPAEVTPCPTAGELLTSPSTTLPSFLVCRY